MHTPNGCDFHVDQAMALRLRDKDPEAWERVEPSLSQYIEKILHRKITTPFQKCHIDDIRQEIFLKCFRFSESVWDGLASGQRTMPEFKAYLKTMCQNAINDVFGRKNKYFERKKNAFHESANADESHDDAIDARLVGKWKPTFREQRRELDEEDYRRWLGARVVSLWRSCPNLTCGKNDAFALLLLFGRFHVLKHSIAAEYDQPQPETGRIAAETLIPWSGEDGERFPINGLPPPIRILWNELLKGAESDETALDMYFLAKITGVRRDALDQKIRRLRMRVREHVAQWSPPSNDPDDEEVARAALALIGLSFGLEPEGSA